MDNPLPPKEQSGHPRTAVGFRPVSDGTGQAGPSAQLGESCRPWGRPVRYCSTPEAITREPWLLSFQSIRRVNVPSRSSSRRSRSSALALVGPIFPIGMSSAAAISSYAGRGSDTSIRSNARSLGRRRSNPRQSARSRSSRSISSSNGPLDDPSGLRIDLPRITTSSCDPSSRSPFSNAMYRAL
jgi:hypothetical protein